MTCSYAGSLATLTKFHFLILQIIKRSKAECSKTLQYI